MKGIVEIRIDKKIVLVKENQLHDDLFSTIINSLRTQTPALTTIKALSIGEGWSGETRWDKDVDTENQRITAFTTAKGDTTYGYYIKYRFFWTNATGGDILLSTMAMVFQDADPGSRDVCAVMEVSANPVTIANGQQLDVYWKIIMDYHA